MQFKSSWERGVEISWILVEKFQLHEYAVILHLFINREMFVKKIMIVQHVLKGESWQAQFRTMQQRMQQKDVWSKCSYYEFWWKFRDDNVTTLRYNVD